MQMLENEVRDKPGATASGLAVPLREFNLLRWFSVISLLIITAVAGGLGYVSTRFVVRDSVQRDAMLTAQFIQAMAQAEVRHSQLPPGTTMGELLDPRLDLQHLQFIPALAESTRVEFLDHVEHLPDTLLANVYARDRTIVWSTNVELIGKRIEADGDLDRAFRSRKAVSASYHKAEEDREEQKFQREPRYLFIENYIPLFDSQGEQVLAMVEIYKEPQDLVRRIQRGYVLIWASTLVGGALIYFGLFWIVRRAAQMLHLQQDRLVASETYVALGEMSSAVAHSLRNPLANIRSSAELAQETANAAAQKNITDIIGQVDRMSRWVRDLLVSLRPTSDEPEAVDLVAAIEDTHLAFAQQIERNGVRFHFEGPDVQWGGQPAVAADANSQHPVFQCPGGHALRRYVECPGQCEGWPACRTRAHRHGQGHEPTAGTDGVQAVLHDQTGWPRCRPGPGQTHHGTFWRLGQPEQPRRGRNPRQPYIQYRSGRGPWSTASW